jgi:hypothetical protein
MIFKIHDGSRRKSLEAGVTRGVNGVAIFTESVQETGTNRLLALGAAVGKKELNPLPR